MCKVYLQITPFFPSDDNFRGAYIFDQVKAIEKVSDFKIIVVKVMGMFEKGHMKPYLYQGILVYPFRVYDLPSSLFPGLFQFINRLRFDKFLTSSLKLNPDDIEIIHSHVLYPCGHFAVDLGCKYNKLNFIQHHGLDVLQLQNGRLLPGWANKFHNRYLFGMQLKVLNKTNTNIGVSQKVIDKLLALKGFNNSSTYVLYNGVNEDKFYKKNRFESSNKFIIGCIANFWPTKDQMTLLRAVKRINNPSIHICFIGTGAMLDDCKEFVISKEMSEQVEFLTEIDHHELNSFYNQINLFVLPSYYEAFGCVYTEALSAGVPIIAVKGQGIEEVLYPEHQEQWLINKNDDLRLAEIINDFIIKGNTEFNYTFNIDLMIKKFLDSKVFKIT